MTMEAIYLIMTIYFVGYIIILIKKNSKLETENEVLWKQLEKGRKYTDKKAEKAEDDKFYIGELEKKNRELIVEIDDWKRQEHNQQNLRNYYKRERNEEKEELEESRKKLEEATILLTKISVETKNKDHVKLIDTLIFKD